jgi:hypothetical protein
MHRVIVLLVFCGTVAGCLGREAAGQEELRSELTLGISVASEAELFIDYVRGQASAGPYVRTHPEYLAEEVRQILVQINGIDDEPELGKQIDISTSGLHELRQEIEKLSSEAGNDRALSRAKERLAAIRQKFIETRSAL